MRGTVLSREFTLVCKSSRAPRNTSVQQDLPGHPHSPKTIQEPSFAVQQRGLLPCISGGRCQACSGLRHLQADASERRRLRDPPSCAATRHVMSVPPTAASARTPRALSLPRAVGVLGSVQLSLAAAQPMSDFRPSSAQQTRGTLEGSYAQRLQLVPEPLHLVAANDPCRNRTSHSDSLAQYHQGHL